MASTNYAYGPHSVIYDEGLQPVSLYNGPFNSHYEPNSPPEVAFFEHTDGSARPEVAENREKEAYYLHPVAQDLPEANKQKTSKKSLWKIVLLASVVIAIVVAVAASVAVTQAKKRSRNTRYQLIFHPSTIVQ